MTEKSWKMFGVATFTVLGALVGGVATADSTAAGTIDSCVNEWSGSIRIIDPTDPDDCDDELERPLAWAQQGPAGPQGPAGATGPAGPAGPAAPSSVRAWAVIVAQPTPHVKYGSHTTNVISPPLASGFRVFFDFDVTQCAFQVTPREGSPITTVAFPPGGDDPTVAYVALRDAENHRWLQTDFQITVTC